MSYAKKGIQWYDSMPMDMQIIYLDRITDDELHCVYNMQFENFADFLAASFVWDHTPEGFEYWLEVSKHNFYEAI